MRKILLALSLMVAAATISHGAAIKWAIGGAIDPNANIDTSVGSFVLAYIGTTSGVGVDAATFNTEIAKENSSYSIADTGAWSEFYRANRQTYSITKSTSVTDVAGATYQIFYLNNGVYSLVNDPTISTIAISIDPTTGGASTTAFINGTSTGASVAYAAGTTAGTAISSVPEPSTAALALAGLALLLKRRKA